MGDTSSQGSLLDRLMAWSQGQREASAQAQAQLGAAQQAFMASAPPGENLLQQWMRSPKGQATGQQAVGYALGVGGGVTPLVGPEIGGLGVADALRSGGSVAGIADASVPPRAQPTTILPSGPTIKLPDQTQVQGVPYQPFTTPDASIVWHGSRHTFEPVEGNPFGEFSDNAVGSGEGAQVYGTGHYVAQNPGTSSYYRTAGIKGDPIIGVKDSNAAPLFEMNKFGKTLKGSPDSIGAAGNAVLDMIGQFDGDISRVKGLLNNPVSKMGGPLKQQMQDFLTANENNLYYHPNPDAVYGNLYQVENKADPNKMLDWEKPFAEQPQVVQDAIRALHPSVKEDILEKLNADDFTDPDVKGGHIMQAARAVGYRKDFSEDLRQAGVHGVKYPDAYSRGNLPSLTNNFVIFDPSHLRIIGKNGVRWAPESIDHDPFTQTQGPTP